MMRQTVPTHNPYIDLFVREGDKPLRYVGQTQWAKTTAEARQHYAAQTNRDPDTVVARKHKEPA
jgi:hypothetical protein